MNIVFKTNALQSFGVSLALGSKAVACHNHSKRSSSKGNKNRSIQIATCLLFLSFFIAYSDDGYAQTNPFVYPSGRGMHQDIHNACMWWVYNSNISYYDGLISIIVNFRPNWVDVRCRFWTYDFRRDKDGNLLYENGRRDVGGRGFIYRYKGDQAPTKPNTCSIGNPVRISDGVKHQREVLFSTSNPFESEITVNYLSSSYGWRYPFQYNLRLGLRWDWEQNEFIVPAAWLEQGFNPLEEYVFSNQLPSTNSADYAVHLDRPDGETLTFHFVEGRWVEVHGRYATLVQETDDNSQHSGWRAMIDNVTEVYNTQGQLLSRDFIGHYSQGFVYTDTTTIINDSLGHEIRLIYDNTGRLVEVFDSNNMSYSLTYLDDNRLESIIYPDVTPEDLSDNPRKIFVYEDADHDGLLTGIIDENNNRYAAWAYDDYRRAVLSEHNNGAERVELEYLQDDSTGREYTRVTNASGKKTDYYFTEVNGKIVLDQVEGHPSANCAGANKAYTYDANGFMASKTDWQGNVTTYIHNDRGQELSRTEASSTPEARTIATEWHSGFHLPTRIVEPGRETVMTYDAQGRLLSRQVSPR